MAFFSWVVAVASPVGVGRENAPVLLVCQYILSGLDTAHLFTAFPGSFHLVVEKRIAIPSQIGR